MRGRGRKAKEEFTLNVLIRQSLVEGGNEIAAFERVAKLAKAIGKIRSNSPPVELPAWTVSILAEGWERYKAAKGELPLGKAFHLEGEASGSHKSLVRDNRLEAYWEMAYSVEKFMDEGHSKTAAIEIVALQNGKTPDQLRKALKPLSSDELAAFEARKAARDT